MITQTTKHTLAALVFLTEISDRRFTGAKAIAEKVGAPQNYLGKLLKTLADGGLLESQKGKGGGFRLARDAAAILLIEPVELLDHTDRWSKCFWGRKDCLAKTPCPVHDRWGQVCDAYLNFLKETSLADLAGRIS